MIYDEEKFVGIILYWEFKKYIYVEHFAICKEYRWKGYGTKNLELMKEMNKIIILEINFFLDDIERKDRYFIETVAFILMSLTIFIPRIMLILQQGII